MELNKKYLQLLTASKPLFYRYGIRKVTVEEICREANVSKMTFYKYFPNKNALVKALLNHLMQKSIDQFRELMESDLPFSTKLSKMMEMKMESTKDVSREFLLTLYKSEDTELSEFVSEYIKAAVQEIIKVFSEAQERGMMRSDIKPALLLAFFDKVQEIATDQRILSAYPNTADLIYDINKMLLYGLSGDN